MYKLICLLLFSVTSSQQCGYPSCPTVKPGLLNIHLVPHSHDDAGWLKTVDQYYYGDKSHIQQAAVQYTIDSVVEQLQKNPDRRFIYVETGFFWRWWTNQDADTKEIVHKLVKSGQLEFINGGWVMNDEATAHYSAIIDQMSFGLIYLNDTFGQCGVPKIAWQIDPFGHSREQASLFAQMGFDGLFFGRLDYQDKFWRRTGKNMEMIWKSSDSLDTQLFTGVLYNGYNPPDGYCFDIFCEDEPINDDPKLFGYNLDSKVENFIRISHEWAAPYRTQNVLMTMGSDFQYMAAHTWYKNLDKLIKYVNQRQENGSLVNLIYSTPSCYLQEVHKAKVSLPTKTDDFFPYASDPHAFWTGYFSSRPTLKYFVQKTNNFLQACKQLGLSSLLKGNTEVLDKIWTLSESMALLQHHDAVSGTAKQHVTDDYSARLSMGIKSCEDAMDNALNMLGGKKVHPKFNTKRQFCQQLNISECAASESMEDGVLSVYNPLPRMVTTYLRIPVLTPDWAVGGEEGKMPTQSVLIPSEVQKIPGRVSGSEFELIFKVTLPGLTVNNYRMTRIDGPSKKIKMEKKNKDFWVKNSVNLSVLFDGHTGLIKKLKKSNTEINFSQNFYFYEGCTGNNSKFEFRASGAYIFRPNTTLGNEPQQVTGRVFSYFTHKGVHVTEVHQVFTEWISQVVRVYDTSEAVEFEWLVGSIPTGDAVGKEIVTRYTTDMKTDGVFYTDANGREILKRKRDFRSTWDYKVHEKVSGNYYPVNSRMLLKEGDVSLILLNDRAQGGTSMNDGEMEIMLHRRLLFDDAFGVGEALDETAYGTGLVARGKHWIVLAGGETEVPQNIHRRLAQEIYMGPVMSFGGPGHLGEGKLMFTNLTKVLPPSIHLLTLQPLTSTTFLLRLEHFYEVGEGEETVRIPMKSLQDALPFVSSIKETNLGANQWIEDVKRLQWLEEKDCPHDGDCGVKDDEGYIVMTPMQIRTFVVGVLL